MSIKLIFACDGCEAVAEPVAFRRKFKGFNGKSYGFGVNVWPNVDDLTPEGWCAADLIQCTYCPKCAAELWPNDELQEANHDQR